MKVLFLSCAVPSVVMQEVNETDEYPPVAADKQQWNIINGIERASGRPVDLLSFVPCSNYPRFPRILMGSTRWHHESGSDDLIVPFINLPVVKHVTQFLSFFIAIVRWLWKNKSSSPRRVLVYMLHSPYVFAALLASRLFGEKPILIVADLPMGASKPKNPFKRFFKPALTHLLLKSLRRYAGLVVLTRQMAEDYAPGVPFIVMEGIVSLEEMGNLGYLRRASGNGNVPKIVTFAGLLREEYGTKLLLDAFALIPDDSYRLWIFGRGNDDMVTAVKDSEARDPRIKYWGFRPNKEVLLKEMESTVLVNPRPSRKFTAYSFPSKLMEYMSIGRPVISAALPGIPSEYHEYLYVWQDETPEGLAELMVSVCSKSQAELQAMGQRAREFVMTEKDYLTQGRRIYAFLQQV